MPAHSAAYLIEEKRRKDLAERTAVLRRMRESAEAESPPPKRRERVKAESPWFDDVLDVVRRINKLYFSLDDVYEYEDELERKHPDNSEVKAHIRHALQLLRNRGILFFHNDGHYTNLEIERQRGRA